MPRTRDRRVGVRFSRMRVSGKAVAHGFGGSPVVGLISVIWPQMPEASLAGKKHDSNGDN